MICVDASVAWKWLFPEEYGAQADSLLRVTLEQGEPMIAPPAFPSEVSNIARQQMRRGGMSLDDARSVIAEFLNIPITIQAPESMYDRALVLAAEHGLPAMYDALYVALAELLGATLWTADERLLRSLSGKLPFVRWIADYRV
ncbi:MAG TPA: type II toxin-antitoxin system VapC family toxin [Chloroflexota bacterium]